MKSAVLLLVFNRPDTTKLVFEAIRKAQPSKLYVAADGPRDDRQGERARCEEVRRIATAVDWNCEVSTLFREKNLGCKIGVSSGIDWFFEHEEEGIILEDDCLPVRSFFDYCDYLLEKYRIDERIWHIDGSSYLSNQKSYSYSYSRYPLIWGWATWKRCWIQYDVNMSNYPELSSKNFLSSVWTKKRVRDYWKKCLNQAFESKIDTWDYQWMFAIWRNNGLVIRPGMNLIKNIGFDSDATHTHKKDSVIDGQEIGDNYQLLSDPLGCFVDSSSDDELSVRRFHIISLYKRILNKVFCLLRL